jgi:uncharacterized protein (DUF1684 family)
MPSGFLRVSVSLWLVVAAAACTSGPSPSGDDVYIKALTAAREFKDRSFRDGADSPIPKDKRDKILPLKYFPVDPAFSVPASLKLADERPAFDMPTSSGALRKMELVGTLDFTLQGEKHSLGAFVPAGTEQITSLFIPFADLTTGMETYAAGRYLDIDPTTTGYYMIDFNRAYNPYCAYNASYECPYPPLSNRMKVAIRVGEKAPGA